MTLQLSNHITLINQFDCQLSTLSQAVKQKTMWRDRFQQHLDRCHLFFSKFFPQKKKWKRRKKRLGLAERWQLKLGEFPEFGGGLNFMMGRLSTGRESVTNPALRTTETGSSVHGHRRWVLYRNPSGKPPPLTGTPLLTVMEGDKKWLCEWCLRAILSAILTRRLI